MKYLRTVIQSYADITDYNYMTREFRWASGRFTPAKHRVKMKTHSLLAPPSNVRQDKRVCYAYKSGVLHAIHTWDRNK